MQKKSAKMQGCDPSKWNLLFFLPGRLSNDPASEDDHLHGRQGVDHRFWVETHRGGHSEEGPGGPAPLQSESGAFSSWVNISRVLLFCHQSNNRNLIHAVCARQIHSFLDIFHVGFNEKLKRLWKCPNGDHLRKRSRTSTRIVLSRCE